MLKGKNRIAQIVYLSHGSRHFERAIKDHGKIYHALSLVNLYFVAEAYTRCNNAAFAIFVSAISRTNSNWFEFMQLIAATNVCRSDNDFHKNSPYHTRRTIAATYRRDVSQRFVA